MRMGSRLIAAASVLWVGVLASQCSPPPPPPASSQALLGEMKPIFSVKELMAGMIDPIADNIFDAVHWNITAKGTIYTRPQNDADWEKVRVGAVSLAEGVYLLKVPRPWTPPGDVNNSTGPNPPELSPDQIKAKVDKDPVLWDAKIEALRNAAKEVMEIAEKRDAKALFESNGFSFRLTFDVINDLDTNYSGDHVGRHIYFLAQRT